MNGESVSGDMNAVGVGDSQAVCQEASGQGQSGVESVGIPIPTAGFDKEAFLMRLNGGRPLSASEDDPPQLLNPSFSITARELPSSPVFEEPDLEGLAGVEAEGLADVFEDNDHVAAEPDLQDTSVSSSSLSLRKYGFVPFYRTWVEEWLFKHKPWSFWQLFMWLFQDANRRARQAEYRGTIIIVQRGCLITSKDKLAKRAGLNPKTIGSFMNKMVAAGEIEVLHGGRNGMLLRLCKYDTYALKDQAQGQYTGRRAGASRDHRVDDGVDNRGVNHG